MMLETIIHNHKPAIVLLFPKCGLPLCGFKITENMNDYVQNRQFVFSKLISYQNGHVSDSLENLKSILEFLSLN